MKATVLIYMRPSLQQSFISYKKRKDSLQFAFQLETTKPKHDQLCHVAAKVARTLDGLRIEYAIMGGAVVSFSFNYVSSHVYWHFPAGADPF